MQNKYYLREASMKDMDLIYRWANDSEVRKNSFSSDYIVYEDHQKWYTEMLKRNDIKQYIFVYNKNDIGQIRIRIEGNQGEIGYSIGRKYRGYGYAKLMIEEFVNRIARDVPQVEYLTAKVKPSNTASRKVFTSCGYDEAYEVFELKIADYKLRRSV